MRDKAELNSMLFEHLSFLEASCERFDVGHIHEGKRIANSIYTLVVDKSRSRSVLSQMGIKGDISFVASGSRYSPPKDPSRSRWQSPPLLRFMPGSRGLEYAPRLGTVEKDKRTLTFDVWWNEDPIFWHSESVNGMLVERVLTRRDLILSLTDQDGGRHFDPRITNAIYVKMKEERSLRHMPSGVSLSSSPELFSARQIGWELKESIDNFKEASGSRLGDPKIFAEINDSKLHFFPSTLGFFASPALESKCEEGKIYEVEVVIDSMTRGSIRAVVNSCASDPILEPGVRCVRVVAGSDIRTGILGEYTDAVVDRISVRPVSV